jgi:hypothetical protein
MLVGITNSRIKNHGLNIGELAVVGCRVALVPRLLLRKLNYLLQRSIKSLRSEV